MKTIAIAAIALTLCTTMAHAQSRSFELVQGKLSVGRELVQQPVQVTNNSKVEISFVIVDCGFFAGSDLVASRGTMVSNLMPGAKGYSHVTIRTSEAVDRAECRISSMYPPQ